MRARRVAAVLAVIALAAGCRSTPPSPHPTAAAPTPATSTSAGPSAPATPSSPADAGDGDATAAAPPPTATTGAAVALPSWDQAAACGVDRWAVKTGMDPAAGQVSMVPEPTTVAALSAVPAPPNLGQARLPQEMRTVQIKVMLVSVKRESDSDYHLVLSDGGAMMIGEIPHPSCVASGPFRTGSAQARAALDALVPALRGSSRLVPVHREVVLTGVVFLDKIHGQTGAARNGVELHPIVALRVL